MKRGGGPEQGGRCVLYGKDARDQIKDAIDTKVAERQLTQTHNSGVRGGFDLGLGSSGCLSSGSEWGESVVVC
jgi:hypothetical protein